MILNQKQTTLAYRCPACYGVPTSIVGAFSLSGSLFKLKCSCGGSHLQVEKTNDGKLRLTVPCLACPQPHSYTISNEVFYGSDIFLLPCSVCGIDLCFIGKEDKVKEAIEISNEEILKALNGAPIESIKEEGDEYFDPQILDIVTYVISDLGSEGKIHCRCPEGQGSYKCDIYNDHATVRCENCTASLDVDITSTMKAHDFLNADELTLK
ncbi:MAG: hypothetical protein IKB27_00950 [Clostridia bacterium]|nr:hypothetical protein [Clostridia bacterium]